jgi:N utilization substance protein B
VSTTSSARVSASARSVARKLALQALYQWQMNDCPWQDLVQEFTAAQDTERADMDYFRDIIGSVCVDRASFDSQLAAWMDREPLRLDPIEHAVLLIGAYELTARPEVPFRVVINEGVSLAKRFGATDGHKFVNAVLDRAARALRPDEH